MAKVRVHELAKEFGVESKFVLEKLKEMGEFVKSASSTVEPPVEMRFKKEYGDKLKSAAAPAPAPAKPAAKPAPAPRPAAEAAAVTGAPEKSADQAPEAAAPAAASSAPAAAFTEAPARRAPRGPARSRVRASRSPPQTRPPPRDRHRHRHRHRHRPGPRHRHRCRTNRGARGSRGPGCDVAQGAHTASVGSSGCATSRQQPVRAQPGHGPSTGSARPWAGGARAGRPASPAPGGRS